MRLLALKASPTAARHRYLLLCSDEGPTGGGGSGWTAVLETGGEGLQSAVLPGLRLDAATLHAGPLAGGSMVQVLPQRVLVFRPGAASGAAEQSSWQPPGGALITLAAQQGQHVAVACGRHVQVLHCAAGTGQLQPERQITLPQQASSLALFQLGERSRSEVGLMCIQPPAALAKAAAIASGCHLFYDSLTTRSLTARLVHPHQPPCSWRWRWAYGLTMRCCCSRWRPTSPHAA